MTQKKFSRGGLHFYPRLIPNIMLTRTNFPPKYRKNTCKNFIAFFKELCTFSPLFIAFF